MTEPGHRIGAQTLMAAVAILSCIVIFFAANIIAQGLLGGARLDLTESGRFTLSPATVETVRAIDEPITLRYYRSREIDRFGADIANHAKRVDDLLAEMEALAGGRLNVEIYDPEPFSPEEDLAVADGIQGIPTGADGGQIYFGLAGYNRTDDRKVISYLASERSAFLDYDLTRLVYDLANPDKPVVQILGSAPLQGGRQNQFQRWAVMDSLEAEFDVRVSGGVITAINDDVDVLMIAQPSQLDQAALYAIDQFAMKGGRILAFVDPWFEAVADPRRPPETTDAFQPLLTVWGVRISEGQVVGDRNLGARVQVMHENRPTETIYPVWLGPDQTQFAGDEVVLGNLERLNINSGGFIEPLDDASTELTPLVWSTDDASPVDVQRLSFPDPVSLMREFEPGGERFTLAARMTGPVASAFPDGPPDGVEADTEAHMSESDAPLTLVLVADADILSNRSWLQERRLLGQSVVIPVANNGDFAVNAVDQLAGGTGLIELRGGGVDARPFTVIEAMERDAEERFRAKERELLVRIEEVEAEIAELTREEQETGVLTSTEQEAVLDNFRSQVLTLRQELREVRFALRSDVERMATLLQALNIWAVPILVALTAIVVALIRRRKAALAN
ncbi:MAG: GldG family protein [Geminicoccaceae bacterium]